MTEMKPVQEQCPMLIFPKPIQAQHAGKDYMNQGLLNQSWIGLIKSNPSLLLLS